MATLRENYPDTKRLFLDANLMVVLIIGQVRPDLFGTSPVSDYSNDDYDRLVSLIREYNGNLVATPYVLSEVSMLLTKTGEYYSNECRAALSVYIPSIHPLYTIPSVLAMNHNFAKFGISDISISDACAHQDIFVLTSDRKQVGLLYGSSIPSLLYKDFKTNY